MWTAQLSETRAPVRAREPDGQVSAGSCHMEATGEPGHGPSRAHTHAPRRRDVFWNTSPIYRFLQPAVVHVWQAEWNSSLVQMVQLDSSRLLFSRHRGVPIMLSRCWNERCRAAVHGAEPGWHLFFPLTVFLYPENEENPQHFCWLWWNIVSSRIIWNCLFSLFLFISQEPTTRSLKRFVHQSISLCFQSR